MSIDYTARFTIKFLAKYAQELQRQRILQRPAFIHQRVFDQWIPTEELYFSQFEIRAFCDLAL